MSVVSIEEVFPVKFLSAPVMVNGYGDIVFCFQQQGVEILTSTKDKFLEMNDVVEAGIANLLGAGWALHQQEIILEATYRSGVPEVDHIISNSFYLYFDGKKYWRKLTYTYVIKMEGDPKNRNFSSPVVLGGLKSLPASVDVEGMQRTVSSFVNHLRTTGIVLHAIKDDDTILKIFQGVFGGFSEGVFQDVNFKEDHIKIGNNKYMGCYKVNNDECLPSSLVPYRVNSDYSNEYVKLYSDFLYTVGFGLKVNHIVNLIIMVPNQAHMRKELEARSKRLNSLEKMSKINGRMKADNDVFLDDTFKGKGKTIVEVHMNTFFWADSKERLNEAREDFLSAFQKLNITPHVSEEKDQKKVFIASLPGNGAAIPHDTDVFVTHAHIAAAMFAKESVVDRSQGKPSVNGLITVDRVSGIPSFRDTWYKPYETKQITARNACYDGATGGGKTFNVIYNLFQMLLQGFFICAVDLGRSMEVFCRVMGGNYIIYEEGMSLGVNPFSFSDGKMSPSRLEYLAAFNSLLWRPGYEMDQTEQAALEFIVLEFYKATKGTDDVDYVIGIEGAKDVTFPQFYEWVRDNQEVVNNITKNNKQFFDVDSFLMATRQFYDGKYSKLFLPGKMILDPNNPLTIFEVDNILENKTLFPIFMMLITHLAAETMWYRKGVNKFVWVEELGRMLNIHAKTIAPWVMYLLKTIRKFDGGVGVSIQQVSDMMIPNSNLFETFKANTFVWNFTKHSDDLAETTARQLGWIREDKPFDHKLDLLKSIKNDLTGKYPYTESLSVVGDDAKVVKTMLSQEQILMCMSDMNDKEKLFPYVEKNGGDWVKGIVEYADVLREKRKARSSEVLA